MRYEFVEEEPQQESLGKSITRNASRQASNLATRAIGLPGDIFSLVNEYIARPTVKAFGQESVPYEETALGKALPTTETHRKGLESLTGEYLLPHNKVEEFADNVIEDTALLFAPGGKAAKSGQILKGSKQIPKNFYTALGANLLGEGAAQATGREDVGALTKLGSLGFLSLVNRPAAAKQAGMLYKEAESAIPKGATANAKKLHANLKALKTKVLAGRPSSAVAPSEKFVVDEVNKIIPLIQHGEIDVNTAWALKRSLNENLSKAVFDIPYKNRARAKSLATQMTRYLRETLEDYGHTNPAFGKPFKTADEAFGTLAKSEFIKNWIGDKIQNSKLSSALTHLLVPGASAAVGALKGAATGGGAGGATVAAYQATKLGYKIAKSPALREMYLKTIKAAAKEDSGLFNKYAKKLDEALQEEESLDRYEFVD